MDLAVERSCLVLCSSCAAFLVQSSGWTRNVDTFLEWLSALSFNGGGFNEAAIAGGPADELLGDCKPHTVDGSINDINRPHFLVLLSESFAEARSALIKNELKSSPSIQGSLKVETNAVPLALEPTITNSFYVEDELMIVQQLMNEFMKGPEKIPAENTYSAGKEESVTKASMDATPSLLQLPFVTHGSYKGKPSSQASSPSCALQEKIRFDDTKVESIHRGHVLSHPENIAAMNSGIMNKPHQTCHLIRPSALTNKSLVRRQSKS